MIMIRRPHTVSVGAQGIHRRVTVRLKQFPRPVDPRADQARPPGWLDTSHRQLGRSPSGHGSGRSHGCLVVSVLVSVVSATAVSSAAPDQMSPSTRAATSRRKGSVMCWYRAAIAVVDQTWRPAPPHPAHPMEPSAGSAPVAPVRGNDTCHRRVVTPVLSGRPVDQPDSKP